jgi:hypothetical protein
VKHRSSDDCSLASVLAAGAVAVAPSVLFFFFFFVVHYAALDHAHQYRSSKFSRHYMLQVLNRPPVRPGGADDIRTHPFFAGFNWTELYCR